MPTTTNTTVTDDDIRALAVEARAHGDELQVTLCNRALLSERKPDWTVNPADWNGAVVLRTARLNARAECERVILAARSAS